MIHVLSIPDSDCLKPGAYNSTVENLKIETTSIQLQLALPIRSAVCQGISTPTDKYTVYFKKVDYLKKGASPKECRNNEDLCVVKVIYFVNLKYIFSAHMRWKIHLFLYR